MELRRDAKFPPIVTSPLEDWMVFLDSIERDLVCSRTSTVCQDLGVLSCGCLVSEEAVSKLPEVFDCDLCRRKVRFVSGIDPIRRIHQKIDNQRKQLEHKLLSGSGIYDNRLSTTSMDKNVVPMSSSNLDFSLLTASNNDDPSLITSNMSADCVETSEATTGGLIQLFKSAAQAIQESHKESEPAPTISTTSNATTSNTSSSEPQTQSIYESGSSSLMEPGERITPHQVVLPNIKSATPSISSEENATSHTARSVNSHTMNAPPPLPNQFSPEFIRREQNYEKCFPMYRKQYQHSTQYRSFLQRSKKTSFSTCISPDATKFAIVNSTKCQIYQLPWDYNNPPSVLTEPTVREWGESPMVSMSNTYLAIANARGILWVYDFNSTLIYHHVSNFIVTCMALSPHDTSVACGIITKNPQSNLKQPVIVLHPLADIVKDNNNNSSSSGGGSHLFPEKEAKSTSASSSNEAHLFHQEKEAKASPAHGRSSQPPSIHEADHGGQSAGPQRQHTDSNSRLISVLIPYCDTLSYLKFSSDDSFLTCSTAAQCRFMVISVVNPKNPRLVMKSSRKSDPDEEFEGITSANFVPYSTHRQYMVVTSTVSTNSAPPIILDTKVISPSTSSVTSSVSQPTLLMRVDKVGSKIHSSAASPRGDAIAFLDKSGLVYVMHAPGLLPDHRKICVATEVAKAAKSSSSASMQFSPSGRVLVIVDRKGDIHIEDYGAGTPQQAGIGRCRLLN
ncbi:hypothetical protein TRICI_004380 [Trichomonascus ciferrii]|uniref:SPS-sensor component PTR3 n=1 Tax=Trichomonascus ciferrii TaxID=44093 RepID=A0A642V152_9ASCO|nr:hypothetical protein TRICI_004380 [Trichomonascus ciferrii]